MRFKIYEGVAWWTVGAQGGIVQPPYVMRWKNRWYRTLPLHNPDGESVDEETKKFVYSQPILDFGVRRCLDYLESRKMQFRDLPLFVHREKIKEV